MDVSQPLFTIGIKDELADTKERVRKHIAIEILLNMIIGKSSKLYKELYEEGILFVTPSLDYEFARGYAHILITGQSLEPEKVYDKFKNRTLYLIYFGLLISVSLFVIGKSFFASMYSSIIMAVGFILLLALRDPTENLLSDILLKNTDKEDKEKAILYFQFMRRLVVLIISLLATMILVRYELIHLYLVLLIFILLYIFMVLRLLSLVNNQNKID